VHRVDLANFDLGPMIRLVAALRDQALTASSVELFAQQVSESLHETFRDDCGRRQTALVRVYVTTSFDALPSTERCHLAAGGEPQGAGSSTVLSLLGTSGTQEAWNHRTRSRDHRLIPLRSAEHVEGLPMIAALLGQLGVDVKALATGSPDVMLKSGDGSCRIFYVDEAHGSPLVPAQDFTERHGIRSVIGFGGALSMGEVFAVVLFCTVPVPRTSAELFETVALSMSLAALDVLDLPLFAEGSAPRAVPERDRVLLARAELAQALLVAHEHAGAAQADLIQGTLQQARYDAGRATAMGAVALRLTGVLTLAEVTEVLMTEGLPVLGADGLSIALADHARGTVALTLSSGFGPAAAEAYATLPLDDALPTSFTARTGEVVILEDILRAGHGFPALLPVARDVGARSLVSLPLRVGDRLLGALTCTWDSARHFDDAGLELVHALAAQAAQAIDRTRLLQQEREHSAALQRSLLTPPPEPDHVEIVVRYLPALEIAQVGGDWYDSFLQQDGATVLVIGDVVGHDTAAAADMGQVRGLLRGIAWNTGMGPADLLCAVDAAVEGLLVRTTASCVVARIEQTEDERARGVTHLRWSNAGHPPPMVINPDGSVLPLVGVGADLLLGVDPSTTRAEAEVTLDRGATVVLYTDGLVERRGEHLEEGLSRLRDCLGELAQLPLEELCDQLLERLRPGADDDIALLAVRLHRQDRPRPVEAGPNVVPPHV
jgi:serine phosphatase RsbU (regulator of sigma subunit)